MICRSFPNPGTFQLYCSEGDYCCPPDTACCLTTTGFKGCCEAGPDVSSPSLGLPQNFHFKTDQRASSTARVLRREGPVLSTGHHLQPRHRRGGVQHPQRPPLVVARRRRSLKPAENPAENPAETHFFKGHMYEVQIGDFFIILLHGEFGPLLGPIFGRIFGRLLNCHHLTEGERPKNELSSKKPSGGRESAQRIEITVIIIPMERIF